MEIKFRAWNECEKIMEYDIQDEYDGDLSCFGSYLNNKFWEVMQYTGLQDINEKEIYEGDIVRLPYCNDIGVFKRKVKPPKWYIRGKNVNYELGACKPECFEVIGTIYENPGLINS